MSSFDQQFSDFHQHIHYTSNSGNQIHIDNGNATNVIEHVEVLNGWPWPNDSNYNSMPSKHTQTQTQTPPEQQWESFFTNPQYTSENQIQINNNNAKNVINHVSVVNQNHPSPNYSNGYSYNYSNYNPMGLKHTQTQTQHEFKEHKSPPKNNIESEIYLKRIIDDINTRNIHNVKILNNKQLINIINVIINNGSRCKPSENEIEIYAKPWTLLTNNNLAIPIDLAWNKNGIGITVTNEAVDKNMTIGNNEIRTIAYAAKKYGKSLTTTGNDPKARYRYSYNEYYVEFGANNRTVLHLSKQVSKSKKLNANATEFIPNNYRGNV